MKHLEILLNSDRAKTSISEQDSLEREMIDNLKSLKSQTAGSVYVLLKNLEEGMPVNYDQSFFNKDFYSRRLRQATEYLDNLLNQDITPRISSICEVCYGFNMPELFKEIYSFKHDILTYHNINSVLKDYLKNIDAIKASGIRWQEWHRLRQIVRYCIERSQMVREGSYSK